MYFILINNTSFLDIIIIFFFRYNVMYFLDIICYTTSLNKYINKKIIGIV
jgi:hypothetical protein